MRQLQSLSIDTVFTQAVERTPEQAAIVDYDTGERYTYRDLRARVGTVATSLAEQGVEPGDRVGVCLKNRPEHVVVFLATQAVGAVTVPFNFRLAADGVAYTLEDSNPELLVFGPAVASEVSDVRPDVPTDEFVYVGSDPPSWTTPYEELESGTADPPAVDVGPEDLSVIQYSSGTTGEPKGIELSHLASVSRVLINTVGQRFRLGKERMLGVMPLYHTVGLHGIFCNMLALSGTYVCLRDFVPSDAVRAIDEEEVTALHEAPTIFKKLVECDATADADVTSVRVLTYSGAPMDSTLLAQVKETFRPEFVSNQYGCTEAYAPLGQINLQKKGVPTETGSANVLSASRIIEIGSGDPGAIVDTGKAGELIISMDSPSVFSGYWEKPEETNQAIYDGWFFTGDVAHRTEEGRTVITGRVDNMIVSGGENIYPSEVEDVLVAHDSVREVGVVGADDDTWGEVPKAYVVTFETVTAERLDRWCRESDALADFKRPREYVFVDELPRNPSGKIKRYKLRDLDG